MTSEETHSYRTLLIFVFSDVWRCIWAFFYNKTSCILEHVGGKATFISFPASLAGSKMAQSLRALTCLFRSSIIRAIWIFFLPISAFIFCQFSSSSRRLSWIPSSTFASSVSLDESLQRNKTFKKETNYFTLPRRSSTCQHTARGWTGLRIVPGGAGGV